MSSSLKEGALDSRQLNLGSRCKIEDHVEIAPLEALKSLEHCKNRMLKFECRIFGSRIHTHIILYKSYVLKTFVSKFYALVYIYMYPTCYILNILFKTCV